jgi:hypothetical protein
MHILAYIFKQYTLGPMSGVLPMSQDENIDDKGRISIIAWGKIDDMKDE